MSDLKRYSDYASNPKEWANVDKEKIDWTKFKIIVPTIKDKSDMIKAIEHFHNQGFDSDIIAVNQLAYEYLDGNNIIVDSELHDKL